MGLRGERWREAGTKADRRQRKLLSDKVGMFHRLPMVAPRLDRGRQDEHPLSDASNTRKYGTEVNCVSITFLIAFEWNGKVLKGTRVTGSRVKS